MLGAAARRLPGVGVKYGFRMSEGGRLAVVLHNDAVVQGLSARNLMRKTKRWGVLTIGTGLGNARFTSEAIDPTLGKESKAMIVDGRVADNTLQQLVLFLVGLLALSVTLPIQRVGIVAACAITFVIVRIAFWLGYRIKPVYRAFGFASTAYMNLAMLVASLWLWVR